MFYAGSFSDINQGAVGDAVEDDGVNAGIEAFEGGGKF